MGSTEHEVRLLHMISWAARLLTEARPPAHPAAHIVWEDERERWRKGYEDLTRSNRG